MKKCILLMAVLTFLFGSTAMIFAAEESPLPPEVPVKGMVTMLDLGATKCIPCKMMAPIIEELKEEYKGKAAILFIDVWEHRDEVPKYNIQAIPTQIFYAKNGEEAYRHVGFMDKESIVAQLQKLGVE
ncbi:thioredoxin family protein [Syntrophobacteraceae bacterium DRH4]|nr:thioredoxin family protein [Desulfoferrobacter suflitae]MCK8603764.1 thioredoxin family protein [Desulfoferrobacter suflitae]